jgi:Mg-chelatase subunit ChlD
MEASMTQKVAICIVLDRSGSMEGCRLDALGAVNSYVRQVREDAALEQARISVVLFDTQGIDLIRDQVPARTCLELTAAEYQPRGGTPLLDAVGHAVGVLERAAGRNRAILVIMTDGHENASREYTKETIAALLKRKQEDNDWLVVYLGADHNAWDQAGGLGLAAVNTARFSKAALHSVGNVMFQVSDRYAKAADARSQRRRGFTDQERSEIGE